MQKQRNPKRFLRRDHNPFLLKIVPQISQINTDLFFLIQKDLCISVKSVGLFLHRISRMNRKSFLLIGLLTDFRGYLASGQWLAPDMCCYCFFCHADFADNADFSSWCFFVPQISQINTDLYEIKNLRHLRNLRDQNLPQKICVHLCKSVGHIPLSGGICIDRIGRFRVNP